MTNKTTDVGAQAEQTARASYGRLLALLAAKTGDITTAEDVLSHAFEKALIEWPKVGIPANPQAWLFTVARNRHLDEIRSARHRLNDSLESTDHLPALDQAIDVENIDEIPDKRLALMFVCAHPAIDEQARTPLMLQTVLGLESKEIAAAFLVPTTTMAARLVRAKRRIRDARIPFAIPDVSVIPDRLEAVLEAVYGAYAISYPIAAGQQVRDSLASEALFLACTLAELMSKEPEALGLAALICLSIARHDSSRDGDGNYVPLDEQNPDSWDDDLIARGERYLRQAIRFGDVGRFQIEAAIQSAHCARKAVGFTDWEAISKLYTVLVDIAPTIGAQVSRIAASSKVDGPKAALSEIEKTFGDASCGFQPLWALRAFLYREAGSFPQAHYAYQKAISLTTDIPSRQYLEKRLHEIIGCML